MDSNPTEETPKELKQQRDVDRMIALTIFYDGDREAALEALMAIEFRCGINSYVKRGE